MTFADINDRALKHLVNMAINMPKGNGKWATIAEEMRAITGVLADGEEWRRLYRYSVHESPSSPVYKASRGWTAATLKDWLESKGKFYTFRTDDLKELVGDSDPHSLVQELRRQGVPLRHMGGNKWAYARGPVYYGNGVACARDIPRKKSYCLGLWADPHLGHKAQQPTHLKDFYEQLAENKCDVAFCAGDALEGKYPNRPEHEYEIFAHGLDQQVRVAEHVFNSLEQILTYFLGSNHTDTYLKLAGISTGLRLENDIPMLRFAGDVEATIELAPWLSVMMWHPNGGGSGEDPMKQTRNKIKSMPDGTKPSVLLTGHYHKLGYECIEGVHCFLGGCFLGETNFAKSGPAKLRYEIGGWIASFKEGLAGRADVEWIKPVRYWDEKANDYDPAVAAGI